MRAALALIAATILVVWVISVAGGTGWSLTVNWTLFVVAFGLLGVRRFA